MMTKYFLVIFTVAVLLHAETLFEVKDSSNNKVLDVSTDGLRILNEGDTLMVISPSGVRVNLDNSSTKALSRTFAVTTSSSKNKGLNRVLEVGTESTTMREGDLGQRYTDFSPDNIFIGLNSGISTIPGATSGKLNVFLGNESGRSNTSGASNIMIGNQSGLNNTTGHSNMFLGNNSGEANIGGEWNLFIGHGSGKRNTSGMNNLFIGHTAGQSNTTGGSNLFIGTDAASYSTTGQQNVFVGQGVGIYNTEGSQNTFIGRFSGNNNSDIYADNNTYVGYKSGSNQSQGFENTYIGSNAGQAKTTGYYNTFAGYAAGQNNSTSSSNTFIGYKSGLNSTGNYNVFLGREAGSSETGSHKLYIENTNSTSPLIYGEFDNDAVTVNGTLTSSGNMFMKGTSFQILTNPGTGAAPTNYVYQGSSVGSTSKQFAFAVHDALWVTSHAYIDGNLQIKGGTAIGMTQAGSYTAGVNSTGGVKTFTITFPTAFGTIPKVNVTPRGENFPDVFAVTTRNISTTSFQVNVYRVDSAGGIWGQNLKLDWFAWE
jgi:hypothetical protein